MKWQNLFNGRHDELARPVNAVDEALMQRIADAKERLRERNVEPVALLRGVSAVTRSSASSFAR